MTLALRELRVRNIRSFEDGTLRLGPGTTLLWGDVGAGKTSLLYAIEMALFGFAEVDATHLVRHRAPTAEVRLTVAGDGHEYVFARRFQRRLRRGRDLFEPDEKGTGLSTDGRTVRYPATELRQRAIALLGFPDNPNPRAHSDLWRWAVYIPQEQMRRILESGDAEARLETVRKALGLERYRVAAENAHLVARALRAEAKVRSETLVRLAPSGDELDAARSALERSETAQKEAEATERSVRAQLESTERDRAAAEATVRRLIADRRELAQLRARAGELDARRQALTSRREELLAKTRAISQEIAPLEATATGLADLPERVRTSVARQEAAVAALGRREAEASLRAAEADAVRTARTRLAEAEADLQRAERESADRHTRLDALPPIPPLVPPDPRSPVELDRALAEAQQRCEASAADVRTVESSEHELGELLRVGRCPRCGQAVEPASFRPHLEEVGRAREQAQAAYEAALAARNEIGGRRAAREEYERQELARLGEVRRRSEAEAERNRADEEVRRRAEVRSHRATELAEAEATVRTHPDAAEALAIARTERDRATRELEDLRRRLEAAASSAAEVKARRETLAHLAEETDRTAREVADAIAARSELTEHLTTLEGTIRATSEAEQTLTEAEGRAARQRTRLETALAEGQQAAGEAKAARQRAELAEARVAEHRAESERVDRLTGTADFLAGPFREAMLEIEHRLLARAKTEFDRKLARYFASLLEDPTLRARSDPHFSPSVELDGVVAPPEALSGGERTALALAYRLALGDVVRGLERLNLATLILDEPTDGFSPEQVQRLGDLLAATGVPQIVLVSHEALLGGVADRILRVQKRGGRSEVSEERTGRATPSDPAGPGTDPPPTAEPPPP